MKVAIIINAARMTDELKSKLDDKEVLSKYQLTFDLFVVEPQKIEAFIKELNYQSYNALIIGGGDGTILAAAQNLSELPIPLAILPLGTFNVLATELGHKNDIDFILSIIKNNKTKQIDLAQVNNKIFVNHSWVGFYIYILKQREKHKQKLGKSKLLKILFTSFTMFRVVPVYDLEIHAGDQITKHKTCLLFVGNNDHSTDIFSFGSRATLSSGKLSVSILNCETRWELFKCMLQIFLRQFNESKYVTHFTTRDLKVTSNSKQINIVLDGELFKMEMPLHYTMLNKTLTVLIP